MWYEYFNWLRICGWKAKNTVIILEKAIESAKSEGAQTEIINLHDYVFVGCERWMACKKL